MKSTFSAALLCFVGALTLAPASFATSLSADEAEFALLINAYRAENSLAAVDVTVTMTDVAQAHVLDLYTYTPHADVSCNLHSWSANGSWSSGCYTPDHANASLMWSKPSEFSNGAYSGNGYELAAYSFSNPAGALAAFKNSSAHNDVILNQGIWSTQSWSSMGVGIFGNYYAIWLGAEVDPQGLVGSSPVPGPASLWLLGVGLLLVAVRGEVWTRVNSQLKKM